MKLKASMPNIKNKLVFLIPLFGFIKNSIGDDPIVHTKVGSIRGIRAPDGDFDQFMGIPYATVDEKNPFGKALLPPHFEEVFDAIDDSAICPQREQFNRTIVGSLDCLHLNVYVPSSPNTTNKLPVMIYIYGGQFGIGFAGRFLLGAKYLVRHDVILVTFNYRVGPYGYMCLDTPEVPGNQGFKDQILAFKWVIDNIESFGGNPDEITVFGNSAGAMSADLHLLSQGEKLFKRMILQSGTAIHPTLIRESDPSVPIKLAELLGYTTSDFDEALSFIAATDPLKLIEASQLAGIRYGVCAEKSFPDVESFLTDYPINLPIPKAEGMSILSGVTSRESMFLARTHEEVAENENVFYDALVSNFNFENDNLVKLEYLLRRFYIGDEPLDPKVIWEIIDYSSDTSFVYATHRNIKKHLDNGAEKIFHFIFSYSGGRNFAQRRDNMTEEGAGHADEIGYLFDMVFIPEVPTPEDQLVLDRVTAMWTNFAKYGDPTPQTSSLLPVKWEPITKDSVYHYLDINLELSARKQAFHQRMAFWDLFYSTYAKFQNGYKEKNSASLQNYLSPLLICLVIVLRTDSIQII